MGMGTGVDKELGMGIGRGVRGMLGRVPAEELIPGSQIFLRRMLGP